MDVNEHEENPSPWLSVKILNKFNLIVIRMEL
jgi:hypothetical protein